MLSEVIVTTTKIVDEIRFPFMEVIDLYSPRDCEDRYGPGVSSLRMGHY